MKETVKLAREIASDVANGRRIFIYLSVAVAVATPVVALIVRLTGKWPPTEMLAMLTLTVLGLVASMILGTQRMLRSFSDEFQTIQRSAFLPIRQYRTWNSKSADNVVEKVEHSLHILTTWPADIHLGHDLKKACQTCRNSIEVKIYVVDPRGPMGPRRVTERLPDFDRVDYRNFPSEAPAREHLEIVRHAVQDIGNRLSGISNLNLTVYAYPTIPTLRLYVVDDKDFFFGWHPLGRLSNQNPCFHVTDSIATRELCQEMRNELENVRRTSRELAVFENGALVVTGL